MKTVADDERVRDVQTKIMHDNAFDQFMNYLHEHNLLNGADVGDFLIVKDEFYIFDIAFYQKLFVKDGFVVDPNSYNFKNIDEFNLSFSRSSFSPGRAFMKVADKLGRKAELEKNYRQHFKFYKSCMIQNQINSEYMLRDYLGETERLLKLSLNSVKRMDL